MSDTLRKKSGMLLKIKLINDIKLSKYLGEK